MGKLEEALKDLRVCVSTEVISYVQFSANAYVHDTRRPLLDPTSQVQLEPANKPAILAARRVRDALTKEMQGRTPVYQVITNLRHQGDAD